MLLRRLTGTKFWRFIRDSGYLALGAMGSGLVSLTWLIISVAKSTTAWGVFLCSAILFCWGAWKAWSKTDTLLTIEKAKNETPEFKGEIEILYAGQCGGRNEVDKTVAYRFIARVSVLNVRLASCSIRGFKMVVSGEEGGRIATLDSLIPVEPHFTLIIPDGNPIGCELGSEDLPYLMDLVRGKKLEQGVHETGWLGFQLKHSILHARKWRYDIILVDAYNNEHFLAYTSTVFEDALYTVDRRL